MKLKHSVGGVRVLIIESAKWTLLLSVLSNDVPTDIIRFYKNEMRNRLV